jgi:cysteine-rich repeat protein
MLILCGMIYTYQKTLSANKDQIKVSRSINSIIFVLLLAHAIFGCSGNDNSNSPDLGVSSDAEVTQDLFVPEDDLGPNLDLGSLLDSDSGLQDDLGTTPDAQVDPDLGSPVDDLGVPPGPVCGDGVREGNEVCDDGNTVSESECPAGMAACNRCNSDCSEWIRNLEGPVVQDFSLGFPDGESVYYVWLPDAWVDFEQAEIACGARGGHTAFASDEAFGTLSSELRDVLDRRTGVHLTPPSYRCTIPVEDPAFVATFLGCLNMYLNDSDRQLQCLNYVSNSNTPCDFRYEFGPYTPYVYGYTTANPRSFTFENRFYNDSTSPTTGVAISNLPLGSTVDIVCLFPESTIPTVELSRWDGSVYEYTYTRLCSPYFSSLNGATCP